MSQNEGVGGQEDRLVWEGVERKEKGRRDEHKMRGKGDCCALMQHEWVGQGFIWGNSHFPQNREIQYKDRSF